MTTRSTNVYERYAATAAESYERHFVPSIGLPCAHRLLHRADLRPGERVLDLACGTGVVAREAAARVGPAGQVSGVDVNPAMLAVARSASPSSIRWHEAPADDLPVADQSFDAVLCSLGFMFFPDRAAAIGEIHRVLAPGGRVVLGTPGPTPPLFEAIDRALTSHVGPGASMFVHAVFSLHEPAELATLLDEAGFEDVATETDRVAVRLAPPAAFFWQYVESTPLAALVDELDDPARAALERDVVAGCQPFVDGDGMVMEPGLLLAVGHRPSVDDR